MDESEKPKIFIDNDYIDLREVHLSKTNLNLPSKSSKFSLEPTEATFLFQRPSDIASVKKGSLKDPRFRSIRTCRPKEKLAVAKSDISISTKTFEEETQKARNSKNCRDGVSPEGKSSSKISRPRASKKTEIKEVKPEKKLTRKVGGNLPWRRTWTFPIFFPKLSVQAKLTFEGNTYKYDDGTDIGTTYQQEGIDSQKDGLLAVLHLIGSICGIVLVSMIIWMIFNSEIKIYIVRMMNPKFFNFE